MPGDLRLTKPRQEVLAILGQTKDHPTATDIFLLVKKKLPSVSLATIYNCLETLASHHVIRQVNLDRQPTRYCANLHEHAHFHCDRCGRVSDAEPRVPLLAETAWKLPGGTKVENIEISLRGLCPACVGEMKQTSLS